MRILFVSKDYFPAVGGVQIHTHEVASRLRARGHAVAVLTGKRPRSFSGLVDRATRRVRGRCPTHVDHRLGYATIRSIVPHEAFAEQVRSFPPNLVVVSGAGEHSLRMLRRVLRVQTGVPTALWLRDVASTVLVAEPDLHIDAVLTASWYIAREAAAIGGDGRFVPSIFDRTRYRVNTSRRVVLFINPVPQKGLDIACSLAELRPDIPFAFARCWDMHRSVRRRLQKRIRALTNVELRPTVTDPAALYGDARILLVPSVYPEAWPRVISESQVSGIPTLAADMGGIPEAVGPGGILVAPDAPIEEWLGALSRLWDNEGAYERYASLARANIERNGLEPEAVLDEIEQLFLELATHTYRKRDRYLPDERRPAGREWIGMSVQVLSRDHDVQRSAERVELSVVIPCLNAARSLPNQLEALARQEWDGTWEVLVVDNGSRDGTLDVAKRFRECLPGLRLIDASDRRGAANATNVGAAQARGVSLIFVDADDEVAPGYLAAMAEALRDRGLVCARMESEKLNPDWVRKSRGRPQCDEPMDYWNFLPYAGMGTIGVRRSVWDDVGGLDVSLLTAQDMDFCWRTQLAGTELFFVRDAVLHCRFRDTLRGMYRQGVAYGRGDVIMYKRYVPRGLPRVPLKDSLIEWKRLICRLPRLRDRAERAWWVRSLGRRVGRLEASLAHRTILL